MKIKRIYQIILILSFAFFYSCKKKEKTKEQPVPVGTIGFHIHITVNDTEVDSGLVMTNNLTNQKIRLDIAKLYLSNITVYKADGTAVPVGGKYILAHMGEEDYTIGEVPTGNYKSLSFNVGIDPSVNAGNPSSQPGALGVQNPSMWFGNTTQGYIFLNVAGTVDTTASHTGKVDKKFAYQLGGNSQLKTIYMPSITDSGLSLLTVSSLNTPGLPAQFHILCDFGILLRNMNSQTQNPVATPFNSDSLAVKTILNNVPDMFRYEL